MRQRKSINVKPQTSLIIIIYLNVNTAFGWQEKHQHCQECYGNTWNDQIDDVEKSLPSYGDIEGDVEIWFRTTRIMFLVPLGWNTQQIPLHTGVEFSQVYGIIDDP